MPLIGQLVLAGAGTLIGKFFQNQSAAIARKREQDIVDLNEAKETFKEVSCQIEEVVFYGGVIVRELMLIHDANELDATDLQNLDGYWDTYTSSFANWSKTHYLKRANVRKSFGNEAEKTYLSIYEEFQEFDRSMFEIYQIKLGKHRKMGPAIKEITQSDELNLDFQAFQDLYSQKKTLFYEKLNSFNLMMSDMILQRKVGVSKDQ